MGRGVDTRDDGQGKANGASPIPIDGDEGVREPSHHRHDDGGTAVAMLGEIVRVVCSKTTLGDQPGASLRGGRVVMVSGSDLRRR